MSVLQRRRTAKGCFHHALWMVAITGGVLLNGVRPGCAEVVDSCMTGRCEVCHAQQISSAEPGSGNTMLRGSDAGSTCLICHEAQKSGQPQGHYVATAQALLTASLAPGQLPPGGDFGWLKRNYSWQGEGGKGERSPGERHGHNIVALDYKYSADTTLHAAPGGIYPASGLSCISCHDPHGNYRRAADGSISPVGLPIIGSGSYSTSPDPDASGSVRSYRMLAGKGYQPKSLSVSAPFTADPPAAVTPVLYNRPESLSDTRVAYGSGMSEWCRNCHALIHNDGTMGTGHPVGNGARLTQRDTANYNSYVKSGDLTGTSAGSYSSMIPFEMGTSDYVLLKATANSDGSNLSGPQDAPNVMCLSCHRAHASGWDSMTRWNASATFVVYNDRYPGIDNGAPAEYAQGRTETEVRKTFYDRPAGRYARYQRSLCNKCHAQD